MSPGHWWRDDAWEGGREGLSEALLGWGVTPLHKAGRVVFSPSAGSASRGSAGEGSSIQQVW